MIDLAEAERVEIQRAEESVAGSEPTRARVVEMMFSQMFPNARTTRDLSPAQRRAWLNRLRTHQRGERLPNAVQPALPFTGGVNESHNHK